MAPGAILLRFLLAITLAKIHGGIQLEYGKNGDVFKEKKGIAETLKNSLQNSPQARIPNLIPLQVAVNEISPVGS